MGARGGCGYAGDVPKIQPVIRHCCRALERVQPGIICVSMPSIRVNQRIIDIAGPGAP